MRKYLRRGLEAPVYGPREPGDRLADRFRSYLAGRLEAFPGLSARRLHREIKAMGYRGACSTLTEYLRLVRPVTPRQFERRFETLAGQQAQVDFAGFQVEFTSESGLVRKVWLFSMVLGHSRWLWGRFWMEDLYFERGGTEMCNCIALVLTGEDLDRLEADVRAGNLPPTSGFFFGASDGSEIKDDHDFIAKARAAIDQGKTVFYDSWW